MYEMFLQRQSPKKAGKEKLHFGLFLGLFFCSIITLNEALESYALSRAFCFNALPAHKKRELKTQKMSFSAPSSCIAHLWGGRIYGAVFRRQSTVL
jgi:hypothetical protein